MKTINELIAKASERLDKAIKNVDAGSFDVQKEFLILSYIQKIRALFTTKYNNGIKDGDEK